MHTSTRKILDTLSAANRRDSASAEIRKKENTRHRENATTEKYAFAFFSHFLAGRKFSNVCRGI